MEWVCRSGLSIAKRNGVGHDIPPAAGRNGDPFGVLTGRLRHLPLVFLFALRKVDNTELDDPPGPELNQLTQGDAEDDSVGDPLGEPISLISDLLLLIKYYIVIITF